jgi:hypothetical protein
MTAGEAGRHWPPFLRDPLSCIRSITFLGFPASGTVTSIKEMRVCYFDYSLTANEKFRPAKLKMSRNAPRAYLLIRKYRGTERLARGAALRLLARAHYGSPSCLYIDTSIVRRSSRGLWGDMLRAGMEIHEYQPTMFHCKVMVADCLLVSVGSANFDDRSFRLNDEANLNIYDANLARQQMAVFEQDLERSRRITHAEWQDRPLAEKMMEHAAAWLKPAL